ncbi:DNA repair protein RAD51 homolog 2 isoform X2 [Papio anubis]|uniref:DNA repair protein RAD51 homolog 2 isoform X2 n=1 Tax=Papio anubis TaxID=9555 RepID=UPI000B7B12F3|nr:DNA repair protein RAD51 homolog 2 isoform X2 [Papio anubis]
MGSKKLKRVGLSQELCDRLSRHQILTCQDFLCLSPLELMKMTGLSYRGVHELLCMVSRACAPKMQTITGPPGCGKTQFCIMMSILATLPTNMGGLEGAVVYIDTESAFSAERLVEIAESRFPRYFNTEEKLLLTSSKVHLYRELTCDEVLQRIESLEEEIISKGIKLVIIDSVASVVRKEFDTQLQGNLKERNKFLAREACSLKYLAEEFSIPLIFLSDARYPSLLPDDWALLAHQGAVAVLVSMRAGRKTAMEKHTQSFVILTNQITTHLSGALASQADLVSPTDDLSLSEGTSGSSCVIAALGNTWSHSVNTRLILQYLDSERRQPVEIPRDREMCKPVHLAEKNPLYHHRNKILGKSLVVTEIQRGEERLSKDSYGSVSWNSTLRQPGSKVHNLSYSFQPCPASQG